MEQEKLTHDAYTVGWVCVLECELNASRALLDKEHERLPSAENDDNVYLLGEMKGHNVAIAFPAIYGAGAAARTATNMIRTFPNIRFGLMVGIGGAVPNPARFGKPAEDIRLGDVIVSEPKGDHGGVIHYDMGQRKADGKLHKRSHLNKPPTMLLNVIKLLRSDHPFGRGEIDRYIADVAQLFEISDAFQAYQHPGRSNDRLFQADYDHDGAEDCAHCDMNLTETRAPRKSDAPVVHYGLIASGNTVIKDPRYREELRQVWGVACFEMEAAGLMDNFSCLVIRGISDYCDTHKNDIWQPYAAVTAAAYAKDLLRVVLPQEVHAAKVVEIGEVLDVLSNIQTGVFMTNFSKTASQENELLLWLQRQEGTGTWLLERPEFQSWISDTKKTIYCRGMPGAGKTVMTAVVVKHLRSRFQDNPAVGIACVYCSVQNQAEQSPSGIFLSLLRQLIKQLSYTPDSVRSMYDRHTRAGDRPSFPDIKIALLDTISCFQGAFIVVDALDELLSSKSPPKQLARELLALQEKSKTNIFATSRYVPEIAGEFKQSILVDVRAAEDDVARFLDSHIGELPAFVSETPGLEDEIKTGIISAIDGMFLLAKLHLTSFLDKISVRDVKDTIKSLPRGFDGYDQSYLEAMNNIRSQRQGLRELATKVLSWICCSRRLLFATELQHPLAVKDKHRDIDEMSIPDMDLIVSVCKGLVIVDGERGTIRLVHYTTQQYFERTWQRWFHEAHERLAETTLRYLTFDTFASGLCSSGKEFKARLDRYVLYDYAARNWAFHVRTALFEETSQVLKLLEDEARLSGSVQAMFAERSQVRSERSPRGMTGLHVAAYFGLAKTVKLLLCKLRPDAKDKDDDAQTPLALAAENGHARVVDLLMRRGADANHIDTYKGTPLCTAGLNGAEEVLRTFLRYQVNINCEDGDGKTPLDLAAAGGHSGCVALLLEYSVPPKTREMNIALPTAAANGHTAVVKLLLEHGADADYRDGDGDSPLIRAAEYGQEEVVDHECGDSNGQTPLNRAAESGGLEAVEILLEHGANSNTVDKDGMTPLMRAAEKGHVQVAETLLSAAVEAGRREVVELLLNDAGVDPDASGEYEYTPLELAEECGWDEIVDLIEAALERNPGPSLTGSNLSPRASYASPPASVMGLSDSRSSWNWEGGGQRVFSPLGDLLEWTEPPLNPVVRSDSIISLDE
ncbi:hypothetical protein BJX64DRAFT_276514 [Aspergillus heterothallicus]